MKNSYVVSSIISREMNLDNRIYETFSKLVRVGLVLKFLVMQNEHNISPLSVMATIEHIAMRTFGWGQKKIIENIRARDIADGLIPDYWVFPTFLSLRTIQKILDSLLHDELLIKVSDRTDNTVFYGLHLPNVCWHVLSRAKKADYSTEFKSRVVNELSWLVTELRKYKRAFDVMMGMDFEGMPKLSKAISEAKKMGLAETIKQASCRSVEAARKKDAKRASDKMLIVDESGVLRIFAINCMSTWLESMRESGVEFVENSYSSKDLGQMKNWVAALFNSGLSEEAIRKKIEFICVNWHKIRSEKIVIDGREIPVSYTPDFTFYYRYRREINSLLEKTKNDGTTSIDYSKVRKALRGL